VVLGHVLFLLLALTTCQDSLKKQITLCKQPMLQQAEHHSQKQKKAWTAMTMDENGLRF
jgi:hypothetical protein